MKCCGEERDSRFCPECGKRLKLTPLVELYYHTKSQVAKHERKIHTLRVVNKDDSPIFKRAEELRDKWASFRDAPRNTCSPRSGR